MRRKNMRDYSRGVLLVDSLVLLATSLLVYLQNYGTFQNVDNLNDEGLLRVNVSPPVRWSGPAS